MLENVDVVAQEALDAQATYVTKRGDTVTVEAPQWAVVLNAQKLAAQLLGLANEREEQPKQAGESPVERIKRLAVVPKQGGT